MDLNYKAYQEFYIVCEERLDMVVGIIIPNFKIELIILYFKKLVFIIETVLLFIVIMLNKLK
ncbi:hypothetical protein DZC34_16895 [Clostridium botulinum]|nr:hypothetical protein DZC34_16895 [Clostridium botulinum]